MTDHGWEPAPSGATIPSGQFAALHRRTVRETDLAEADAEAELDEEMMRRAIELAREARNLGEVPVGAVVARHGTIIAAAHNLRESLRDPTAHAERLALTWAAQSLGSWRLDGCALYVTLEPCAMCAGAVVLSRIGRLVYGATDPKAGACASLFQLVSDPRLNHRARITAGVLAAECSEILTEFFQERRGSRKIDAAE